MGIPSGTELGINMPDGHQLIVRYMGEVASFSQLPRNPQWSDMWKVTESAPLGSGTCRQAFAHQPGSTRKKTKYMLNLFWTVFLAVVIGFLIVRFFDATAALAKISPKLLLAAPFVAVLYGLGMIVGIATFAVVVVFVWPALLAIFLCCWFLWVIVMALITLIYMLLYPFWKVASAIKAKYFPPPDKPITYSYVDRHYGLPPVERAISTPGTGPFDRYWSERERRHGY